MQKIKTHKVPNNPTLDSNEAFRYFWQGWRALGLDPPPNRRYYAIYQLYAFVLNMFITVCLPASLVLNLLFIDNLQELLINLSTSITILISSLKLLGIYSYRETLKSVAGYLRPLDVRCAQHETDRRHIQAAIRICRIFYVTYLVFYMFVAMGFAYIGITNHRLVFNGWYPRIFQDDERNFWLAIWYQTLAISVAVPQNSSNDVYPLCYLTMMIAHLRALRGRIERIGAAGTPQMMGHNFQELVACVQDHKHVLSYFQLIRRVISRTIAMQFLITAFVLCVTVVNVIAFDLDTTQLLITTSYLLAVLFEVLPCCWFVNVLMDESSQLTNSLYSCLWYEQNELYRKTLIIFMQRTQKTVVIMAGNLAPVTLQTFMMIIKFSFSLFTILSNLKI